MEIKRATATVTATGSSSQTTAVTTSPQKDCWGVPKLPCGTTSTPIVILTGCLLLVLLAADLHLAGSSAHASPRPPPGSATQSSDDSAPPPSQGGWGGATLLIVVSMQRSASTSLIGELNDRFDSCHRNTTSGKPPNNKACRGFGYEIFNNIQLEEPVCDFVNNFVASRCHPGASGAAVCGFKVFNGHLHPYEIASMLRCGHIAKLVVLRRRDNRKHYDSYHKAMTTGDWGTNPAKHQAFDPNRDTHWISTPKPYTRWLQTKERWYSNFEQAQCVRFMASEDFIADMSGELESLATWVKTSKCSTSLP